MRAGYWLGCGIEVALIGTGFRRRFGLRVEGTC